MTSLEAYTVLNNFRIDASGEVVPGDRLGLVPVKDDKKALDLTDGRHFEWWRYLASHPEGEKVVGQGVTKFELRFLSAVDPNDKQQRLDFIVTRETTEEDPCPHVRLNPHNHKIRHIGRPLRKEALPVYGVLPWWLKKIEYIPVASVTCGAPSPAGLTERTEHAAPRQDFIGEGEAWEFIQKLNREETVEFVDLTDGIEFRWQRWNLPSDWSERIKALSDSGGITHFCAVRDAEKNTFVFVASTANDEVVWTLRPISTDTVEVAERPPDAWWNRTWARQWPR